MKKAISIVVILFIVSIATGYAQKGEFIRIYGRDGKKCCKGRLIDVRDSSLILLVNSDSLEVNASSIATIKMKRAFGSNTIKAGLIGGGIVAILGAVTADEDAAFVGWSVGGGLAAGFVTGAVSGALVGLVIDAATNRPEFLVNQSQENWNKIKETLRRYSALARANKTKTSVSTVYQN